MSRRGNAAAATAEVHYSPRSRATEKRAIDMDELWAEQHVEHGHWLTLYAAIVSAEIQMLAAAKSEDAIDYEQLATETDLAYARYAARLRNMR